MRQLTSRETAIVAIAAVLAVVVPLYSFVFAPQLDTVAALNRRIEAQTRTLAGVEAAANRLPVVEGQHAAIATRVREMEQRMPTSISISGVMGRLSVAIATSGIQLIEIAFPAGTQPSAASADPVQELPFTIRFRATYARMVAFLQQIESPPAVVEQSLSVANGGPPAGGAPGGGNPLGLEITLGMKAFALR